MAWEAVSIATQKGRMKFDKALWGVMNTAPTHRGLIWTMGLAAKAKVPEKSRATARVLASKPPVTQLGVDPVLIVLTPANEPWLQ
jgi:hypothetical protein